MDLRWLPSAPVLDVWGVVAILFIGALLVLAGMLAKWGQERHRAALRYQMGLRRCLYLARFDPSTVAGTIEREVPAILNEVE